MPSPMQMSGVAPPVQLNAGKRVVRLASHTVTARSCPVLDETGSRRLLRATGTVLSVASSLAAKARAPAGASVVALSRAAATHSAPTNIAAARTNVIMDPPLD